MPDLKRIMIIPQGEWNGHPMGVQSYGEAELAAIVSYFNDVRERSGGKPVQIDYEHQSLNPNLTGLVPAAGWIHELELDLDCEEPGVYGKVEWTAKAEEAIKAGELRSLSPVIAVNDVDPVTGETVPISLFNAAATNQPFMHDKMLQLAASAIKAKDGQVFFTNSKSLTFINNQGGNMPDLKETVDAIVAALPGAQSGEDVMNFLKKALDLMSTMPGSPEGGQMPAPEQMDEMAAAMSRTIKHSKTLSDVASYLECNPDEVLTKVTSMSNKTDDATKLRTELDKIKAEFTAVQIDKLVNDTYANKIPPAKREFWSNYAKAHGIEATESVLKEQEDVLPTEPVKPNNKAIEDKDVPEQYIAHALKMNRGMSRERAIEHYKKLHTNKTEA